MSQYALCNLCIYRSFKENYGGQRLEKHFIAKVVAGHRVTIPKEVCQVLGIVDGNLVEVNLSVVEVLLKIEDKPVGGTMKWK